MMRDVKHPEPLNQKPSAFFPKRLWQLRDGGTVALGDSDSEEII